MVYELCPWVANYTFHFKVIMGKNYHPIYSYIALQIIVLIIAVIILWDMGVFDYAISSGFGLNILTSLGVFLLYTIVTVFIIWLFCFIGLFIVSYIIVIIISIFYIVYISIVVANYNDIKTSLHERAAGNKT